MKKYLTLTLITLGLHPILQAQVELVPNSYFEFGTVPTDTLQASSDCQGVFVFASSDVDYFGTDSPPVVGIPSNIRGTQTDINGGGRYLGMAGGGTLRAGLFSMVSDTMRADHSYRFTIVFSLSDNSKYACDSLGVYLAGGNTLIPTLSANRFQWTTFSHTFTPAADGIGIILGFGYRSWTAARRLINPTGQEYAYYYIARISVEDQGLVGVGEPSMDFGQPRIVREFSINGGAAPDHGLIIQQLQHPNGGLTFRKVFR